MSNYIAHPLRFQLKRTKGWRKPEGAVVVARPSKWGNPFRVGDQHPEHGRPMTADEAVELFRAYMVKRLRSKMTHPIQFRAALIGRPLGCWCPLDQPCHADVLCEFANIGSQP